MVLDISLAMAFIEAILRSHRNDAQWTDVAQPALASCSLLPLLVARSDTRISFRGRYL